MKKRYKVKSVPNAEHGTTMYALANDGLQIEDGKFEMLSPDTLMLKGNTHEKGGTMVNYKGNTIEAEAGEPMSINGEGEAIVWGNMKVPGTNKKFKQVAKEIGDEEAKTLKMANQATELVNTKNPYDRYQIFGFNSGRVMADAAKMKQKALSQAKEMLGDTQQSLLEVSNMIGQEPQDVANTYAKGGYIPYADSGAQTANNRWLARQAAKRHGVPEWIINRLITQESGGHQSARSNVGAQSFMQFMPGTAKEMGLNTSQLTSNKAEDRWAVADAGVRYFKKLMDQNNGDIGLALVAYNGGQGAVNFAKKKLGTDNITFADWNQVMADRRQNTPSSKKSAWQNQTFEYANNILNTSGEEFYGSPTKVGKAHTYRQQYYSPEEPRPPVEDMQPLVPIGMKPLPVEINTKIAQYVDPSTGRLTDTPPTKPDTPYKFDTTKPRLPHQRMPFDIPQILPELATIFDRPDFVRGQQFDPTLYTPYNVSFQDKLNENNATFRQTAQQLSDNPAALASLAGQKYQQDNAVLSEQFRTNQGIANDVINKNNALLNQAKMTNLQLQDTQFTRQTQAKANTEARRLQGLQSLANKYAQYKRDKYDNNLMEQFSDYRLDPETGDLKYMGKDKIGTLNQYFQQPDKKVVTKTDDTGKTTTTTTVDPYAQQKLQQRTKSQWPFPFFRK